MQLYLSVKDWNAITFFSRSPASHHFVPKEHQFIKSHQERKPAVRLLEFPGPDQLLRNCGSRKKPMGKKQLDRNETFSLQLFSLKSRLTVSSPESFWR